VMQDVCDMYHGGDQEWLDANPPIFSFDNAGCHAGWERVIPPTHRSPLPARSPGMHKVIEHSYNYLTQQFRGNYSFYLARKHNLGDITLENWIELVHDNYFSLPLSAVQDDVRSLFKTYKWIKEHGGGKRAPRGLTSCNTAQ